jgi:hypothetical protein
LRNQYVTAAFPTKSDGLNAAIGGPKIAAQLREIARAVRRIGDPFRADPETLCIQKDEVSRRLIAVAALVERAA